MNWGKGIAIFLTVFVLFILGLMYMASQSTFDLEAEDYYAQEISYQDRIDALSAGSEFEDAFSFEEVGEQLIMRLEPPADLDQGKASVTFYRANDSSLDRTYSVQVEEGVASFTKADFVTGKYEIRIEWETNGELRAIVREFQVS